MRSLVAVAFALAVSAGGAPDGGGERFFLRGDTNGDGQVNLADAILTLQHLFGGTPIECEDAADANDDGVLNLADAVFTLSYLFGPVESLPPPSGEPGPDPTPDDLTCASGPIVLSHAPRQCYADPWDRSPGATLPEKVRNWGEKLGATIIEAWVKQWDIPVCMACGCPRGYSIFVTVPTEEDAEILKEAGFGKTGGPIRPDPRLEEAASPLK